MPISRDQFDKGLDETRYQLLKFLTAHPDQAFTVNDLGDSIFGKGPTTDIGTVVLRCLAIGFGIGPAIDDLTRQGLVAKKVVDGEAYYCIRRG